MTAPCDARCCDEAEVPLLEDDVARLERTTGRPRAAFVEPADGWWMLKGTGTGGGCVFLGTVRIAGRDLPGCTVHSARPEACRHYPFILDDAKGGASDGPAVARDGLCPFRAAFPMPEGVRESLLTLERQLDEERRERSGDHVR